MRCPTESSFATFIADWNTLQRLEMPALHAEIAEWLGERHRTGDRELLLMAFRGAGKSTLVGLFAAWLLSVDPARRILVLSADHALARRMVRNVKRLIERHPATAHLKPAKLDEWAADRFTVERDAELRDPSMLAKGIGANITGCRADAVICDDVEVPNTSATAAKREDLRERLDEIDYVLVPGGLKLFVGTPHCRDSLYRAETPPADDDADRPYLAGFARLELPLLTETGRSRWPERFSPERIERIRTRSGPIKFQSQMMLRATAIADGRLDADRLVPYDAELSYTEGGGEAVLRIGERRLVSAACWWDPAYGDPDRGDGSVIACVFTDEDGNLRLHALEYLAFDRDRLDETDELTQQCEEAAAFAERHYLPFIRVEENGIGKTVPGALKRVIRERGDAISVVPAFSKRAKALRILDAFDAPLAAGRLFAHAGVLGNARFMAEMRDWRPDAQGRDDGLDAVAGCLLSEPQRLPLLPPSRPARQRRDWRRGLRPTRATIDFDV
ncbi:MAG: phage terminase large subunit [Rhodospirillales bacterium]